MKIKEIYIKDFRQFKDFTLDLTYPAGHEKAGQPLEKVCFIGQSGTGKTTLLKLIYSLIKPGELIEKLNGYDALCNFAVTVQDIVKKKSHKLVMFKQDLELITNVYDEDQDYEDLLSLNYLFKPDILANSGPVNLHPSISAGFKLIYLPADLKFDLAGEENKKSAPEQNPYIFDFSKASVYDLWNNVTAEITRYQEAELAIRQKISVVAETGDLKAIQQEVKKLEDWRKSQTSPVQSIADKCIDQLIQHFSLRVKQDLDIQQKEDIGFIKIEDFSGKEVPFLSWSTGTKQIILSMLPLYLLKPENSLILIDEPERSLYPDLQRTIIDKYQQHTTNCQTFYATHSPIIAASFEPWEIVELKFDKDFKVYREKYYEGENHVDNYTIDPRFLGYDMVLKRVFDMEDTNEDIRNAGLAEYQMLKNQLAQLKKEGKLQTPEGEKIYKKFDYLAERLAVNP